MTIHNTIPFFQDSEQYLPSFTCSQCSASWSPLKLNCWYQVSYSFSTKTGKAKRSACTLMKKFLKWRAKLQILTPQNFWEESHTKNPNTSFNILFPQLSNLSEWDLRKKPLVVTNLDFGEEERKPCSRTDLLSPLKRGIQRTFLGIKIFNQ